ncbi:hypothetical protein BDN71DRAFT_1447451, partial [Pleurotus eryngii]
MSNSTGCPCSQPELFSKSALANTETKAKQRTHSIYRHMRIGPCGRVSSSSTTSKISL